MNMDIKNDIQKVIESLNFLIYDVYEGVDVNNEQQFCYCFSQFNLFMNNNEYFKNIKLYNKEENNKLLALATDSLAVIYDTQLKLGEKISVEDKDKFNALTNMGMILAKAYLYSYLRVNDGKWPEWAESCYHYG